MTRYVCAVDPAAVSAIDVHTHIEQDSHGHESMPHEFIAASEKYFKAGDRTPHLETIAERYREWGMAAVIFTVDSESATGHPPISSEEIATQAADHADVLIPFGSVDPRKGRSAVEQARRLVEDNGVMGFKFHPSLQDFDPSDDAFFPLWSEISDLGVPALFHTGQNGIGAGLRGGGGIKLARSNPLLLDEIAADFPDLDVIMAHPSVPWQEEANSIATHKSNVWIDLSGWSPKYFPNSLIAAANRFFPDRVLFGTDYPLIPPDKWLRAFEEREFRDEIREDILKNNVARLLGLTREDNAKKEG
jgi:predicted TIM-barrel fold metal-dependent hydrolase